MNNNSLKSLFQVTLWVLIPFAVVMALRECSEMRQEKERLSKIQDILLHNGEVEIGVTPSGKSVASSTALHLTASDLRRKPDSLLAKTVKDLKIKSTRVVAAASAPSSTNVDVVAAINAGSPDCGVGNADSQIQAIQHVSWSDPWMRLDGTIEGDTLKAHIESRDTLQMVIHRVPKKFLFFRFGTKAVRMEVVSQNPHTTLSYPKLLIFTDR